MKAFLAAFLYFVLASDGTFHLKPGYCAPGEAGPAAYLDRSFTRDYARAVQTDNCAVAVRAARLKFAGLAP